MFACDSINLQTNVGRRLKSFLLTFVFKSFCKGVSVCSLLCLKMKNRVVVVLLLVFALFEMGFSCAHDHSHEHEHEHSHEHEHEHDHHEQKVFDN